MDAVIFDIDGVLAENWQRAYFLEQDPPDWEAFFKACADDVPGVLSSFPVIFHRLLDTKVFLISSRPEYVREETETWLKKHGIYFDKLYLIDKTKGEHNIPYKVNTVAKIRELGYYISYIFEDDPNLIAAYRENDYPVVPIWSGIYPMPVLGPNVFFDLNAKDE
jgi:FMN phosphatase YigB (HAD superfamily)